MPERTVLNNPEWDWATPDEPYVCPIVPPPVDLVAPHHYTDQQYAARVARVWAGDLPWGSGRSEDRQFTTREQFDEGRRATAKSWVNPYAPYTK